MNKLCEVINVSLCTLETKIDKCINNPDFKCFILLNRAVMPQISVSLITINMISLW